MKMKYWMALPLILGVSSFAVACGSPEAEVDEGIGEEEVLEEEGIGEEEELMEEQEEGIGEE